MQALRIVWSCIAQDNSDCSDKLLDEIEEASRKQPKDTAWLGLRFLAVGLPGQSNA